ncbi:MAG: protein phosphatase 2C domain-containing protein [Pyrinomonadaceae bacterium]
MFIVETHATSHVGRVRTGNEDNFLILNVSESSYWTIEEDEGALIVESQRFEIDDRGVVLAVSDGMGGALAGEVASKMAVETVTQVLLHEDPDKTISPDNFGESLVGKLFEAISFANHKIHLKGREPEYHGMGATFTGVTITPDGVGLIQIGDSRAYLIRNGKIYQVTKDQSLVQQLVDSGQITEEEAETHVMRNVILQALGAQNEIDPVAAKFIPSRDDVLVVCSDGLSNKVDPGKLQQIVYENIDNLKMAAVELVKEANDRGGEDNITLVIAKLSGSGLVEADDDEIRLDVIGPDDIHDTADQDTAEIL